MWVFRVRLLTAGMLAAFVAQPVLGANLFVNGDFEDLTDWGAVGAEDLRGRQADLPPERQLRA